MEGGWGLAADFVSRKCNGIKRILDEDIDDLNDSLTALQNISNDTKLIGDTFKQFKTQLQDYDTVIRLLIMADEKDKDDCDALIEKTEDRYYNGDFTARMYNDAEKDRDEYKRLAADEWKKADEFCTVVREILPSGLEIITHIANPHIGKALEYDRSADLNQVMMNEYQADKDAFDTLDEETSKLLTIGNEYRKLAKILLGMMDKAGIDNTYNAPLSNSLMENPAARASMVKIEKDSFETGKEAYKHDHPEQTEMVDRQSQIYSIRERMANSKSEAEKAAMQKELDRLEEEQRKDFCKNFYKYDSNGNIVGNNMQEWEENGQKDVIDFFSKVYRSNNHDLLCGKDSNIENINIESCDKVESINKLKKLKEENSGNSAVQAAIQSQIDKLEQDLESNGNGVVNWVDNIHSEDDNAKISVKKYRDYLASTVIANQANYVGENGYFSKRFARNIVQYVWKGTHEKNVNTLGITISGTVLNYTGGVSVNVTTDPKANVCFSVNPFTGASTSKFSASFVGTKSKYMTDDLNNLENKNISVGASYNPPIPKIPPIIVFGVDGNCSFESLHKKAVDQNNVFGYTKYVGVSTPSEMPSLNVNGYNSNNDPEITFNYIDWVTQFADD